MPPARYSVAMNGKSTLTQPTVYQIRLEGHLGSQWTAWFEGVAITLHENGDTILQSVVVDQAELYGLLRKMRDLGMPLVEVKRMEDLKGKK